MTYISRQSKHISISLIFAMCFSFFLIAPPPLEAGSIGYGMGDNARRLYKAGGPLSSAVVGAVLGSFAGPVGMIAGATAGYTLHSAATRDLSRRNLATFAGAAVGVALTATLGPVGLVAGLIGGGIAGRIANSAVGRFIRSSRRRIVERINQIDHTAAAAESEAGASFIASMNRSSGSTTSTATPDQAVNDPVYAEIDAQEAYERYTQAYQKYTKAIQQGSNAIAQAAHQEYRRFLDIYNSKLRNR